MKKSDSSEVLSKKEREQYYAQWDNEEVKKEFFNHNVRLASYVTRKYLESGIEYDDLTQLAQLGLWKAVQTFKPEKGYQFATYAIRVMDNEILMQLRKGKGTMLVDEKRVVSTESLLSISQNGETLTFEEILQDDNVEVESDAMGQNLNKVIKEFIDNYDPKYVHIIRLHMKGLDQKRIAQKVNLSQSYISRIILKFKKEMKKYLHNNWDINIT